MFVSEKKVILKQSINLGNLVELALALPAMSNLINK